MLVVDYVGDEILGEVVGTKHPGFANKRTLDYAYERDERSAAYVKKGHGEVYYCFPDDVLVRVKGGFFKKINEIKKGNIVLTAEGNLKKVLHVFNRDYDGDLCKLVFWGHNDFRCTPEHPILTDVGYIPAKELKNGDFVCVTKAKPTRKNKMLFDDVVKNHEYSRNNIGIKYKSNTTSIDVQPPPKEIILNYEAGRLFGLYAAEGHSHPSFGACWSFGSHEGETLVRETVGLIKTVLGVDARIHNIKKSVSQVEIRGIHWRLFFGRLFGSHSYNKTVKKFLSCSDSFKEGLFYGWLDGDGHKRRNEIVGKTVSREMGYEMFSIASDLGMCPTMYVEYPNQNQKTRLPVYRVCIPTGEGASRFRLIKNGVVYRKVKSINYERYVGKVYNLEVEENNSYTANCIGVHNCGGFNGGRKYLELAEKAKWLVDLDSYIDYVPEWHDESFINKIFLFNPPDVVLGPEYCYPDYPPSVEKWGLTNIKPKILALEKHK
jgi:helicase